MTTPTSATQPVTTPGGTPGEQGRRRVLVTGSTRGIGRAIAADLAACTDLYVAGRDAQQVERVRADLGAAGVFVADLTDETATERAAASLPPLDVVVHCAGVMPPEEGTLRQRWRSVLEVNVVSVVHLTELLLPGLRERNGLLVFVNSGSGLRAFGDTGGYSASKFALTSYAEGLREQERGVVRVASLHPGRVDTEMQRELQRRAGRDYRAEDHMSPRTVALAVRAIVESPVDAVIESLSIRPA